MVAYSRRPTDRALSGVAQRLRASLRYPSPVPYGTTRLNEPALGHVSSILEAMGGEGVSEHV